MNIEQICTELINEDKLYLRNRKSNIIHKKSYLIFKLKQEGLMWTEIGYFFDMTHSSIIHLHKNAEYWEKTKDELYFYDTHLYRIRLENIPAVELERNLENEVLECSSKYQLDRIKERIVKKYYQKAEIQ